MKFTHGTTVSFALAHKIAGTTNCKIVGNEWGGDNRFLAKDCWYYYLAPCTELYKGSWLLAAEDQLSRISG
jgi:hypothetical protein